METINKIKINEYFTTTIDGDLYKCRLVTRFFSVDYSTSLYLEINKIKIIELSWWKKLLSFSNEKIEWFDKIYLESKEFLSEYPVKVTNIDGDKYFEIQTVKYWVKNAIGKHYEKINIEKQKEQLKQIIKHQKEI